MITAITLPRSPTGAGSARRAPGRAFLPALAVGGVAGLAASLISLLPRSRRAQGIGQRRPSRWHRPASLLARTGAGALLGLLLWAAYKAAGFGRRRAPRYPGLGPA